MVVRWVHRSSFTIRPLPSGKPLRISVPKSVGPGPGPGGAWFVDPGWYGTVVDEAEALLGTLYFGGWGALAAGLDLVRITDTVLFEGAGRSFATYAANG